MFAIASNITSRDLSVARLLRRLKLSTWTPDEEPLRMLRELVQRCVAAGADVIEINVQQHSDHPDILGQIVRTVQEVTVHQICLSTNNPAALEAGLKDCRRFPIVNYIAIDEKQLKEALPLAARYGAEIVLLVSDSRPTDAQEMMQKAAVLVGAANEVGIPNNHILIDPGLIHITHDAGQRHFTEVKEFLRALPETFDPPVKSTAWPGNLSADAPPHLRPAIESTALAEMAALGLDSAFVDILSPEIRRTLRLLKVLDNEAVYADSDF